MYFLLIIIIISILLLTNCYNNEKYKQPLKKYTLYPSKNFNSEIYISKKLGNRITFFDFMEAINFCNNKNDCIGIVRDTIDGVLYIPKKIDNNIKLSISEPKTISFIKTNHINRIINKNNIS